MPEDYDKRTTFNSFIPLVIFLGGFFLSAGYQLIDMNNQRVALHNQVETAKPIVVQAQAATSKLYAVAQDLIQLSAKNTYAAQIVKEANIQLKAPAGGANAAPAASAPAK